MSFRNLLILQDRQASRTPAPAVDIYETEKEIVLKADLPGVNLSDVDIQVENNVLTVRGERHFEKEVSQDNFHRVERGYGSFARTFTLPETVDSEKIAAEYESGVLKITMAKHEQARPKQIKIAVTAKAA